MKKSEKMRKLMHSLAWLEKETKKLDDKAAEDKAETEESKEESVMKRMVKRIRRKKEDK